MNQDRKEELIVRWMDGALSAAEVAELEPVLAAEPELNEMKQDHSKLREGLREVYPSEVDLPYSDFFQSKLKQAIRDSDVESKVMRRSFSLTDKLRWWLAPVAMGAMVLAFCAGVAFKGEPDKTGAGSLAFAEPVLYTPSGGVTADYLRVDNGAASVILLEGLEPIPDSFDFTASRKSSPQIEAGIQLISSQVQQTIY